MQQKLEWYVFHENTNQKEIEPFNVFNSVRFYEYLLKLKKELKKKNETFEWFSKELKEYAMYCFWSKCEYEVIIKPLFGEKPELKIDIHTQLNLNWDKFARYVFDNLKLVK